MKYVLLSLLIICFTHFAMAQTPDDAIRNSYQIQQGTARNMAIGGAAGSLGGDLSSANVNPAGLGLFRTNEWVISPGYNFLNNKYNFRGSTLANKQNNFSYGASGFIFGTTDRFNKKNSHALSLSINQVASFNNKIHYKGFNNASSWSEQYLEELVNARADTNKALTDYIFGSSLAFRTFLIDADIQNNQLKGYQSLVPISSGVNQENDIETTGGIHEISLGLASNHADKIYVGASIGIPIYSYSRTQVYKETDATNNPNNSFSYFEYVENYNSTGVGINAKFGLIYKPADKLRLGIALHTPTFATLSDDIRSSLTANTETYAGTKTESSNNLNSGNPGQYKYTMVTPWKAIVSASYVFNEVKDVRRQKAFITADAEYVRHQGTQYDIAEGGTDGDKQYYKTVNAAIDSRYKGTINLRLGGEVKFTTVFVRGGFAYYGNPYRAAELKNNRLLFSGGLGYRNKGIFVDLGLVYTQAKDTHIPYYLADKPNTYAVGSNNKTNAVLTFGCKF